MVLEEFLKKMQFDQCFFPFSRGLLPREYAIMSHNHTDHKPNFVRKEFIPKKIYVPVFFSLNFHSYKTRIIEVKQRKGKKLNGSTRIWPLGRNALKNILKDESVEEPSHAAWWLIRNDNGAALFVGELDFPEIEALKRFLNMVDIKILLLPIYNNIENGAHRTNHSCQLKKEINKLAYWFLKNQNGKIWGLPHTHQPKPKWATIMAKKLEMKIPAK